MPAKKPAKPKLRTAYKCTGPAGLDFRTGTINYEAALQSGEPLSVANCDPPSAGSCGRGLHVSPTPRATIQFANRSTRPWRWFKVAVKPTDVIAECPTKLRVKSLRVTKEISLEDIFGTDLAERIAAVKAMSATWKTIPWFKPTGKVSDATLKKLFREWLKAITPYVAKGQVLPDKVLIVRDRKTAAAAADAAAADAVADAADAAAAVADAADAAAADAAAADAAVADAADAAAVAADAAAVAADAAAAVADAADAAAAVADAVAADAAAAVADAADAAAAVADAADAAEIYRFNYYSRWYVRPWSVLRREAWWLLAGNKTDNPFAALNKIYKLGCWPIGYSGGSFVIYCPTQK